MVGYHNHPGMFGKPVKWKSEWLKTKFIDNVQKVGNETWYISIDSYSARVNIERTVSGIHIGEDFKNIIKGNTLDIPTRFYDEVFFPCLNEKEKDLEDY